MPNKPSPLQVAEDAVRRAQVFHDEWMKLLGMVDYNSLLELPGATTEDTMRLQELKNSLQNRRMISPDAFVRLVSGVAAQTHAVRGVKLHKTGDEHASPEMGGADHNNVPEPA